MKLVLALFMSVLVLAGCATPNAMVEIQGEVLYQQPMALAQDAVLRVQVKDISLMGAPVVVMAEIEISAVTSPAPFHFLINRDQFEAGHSYEIGASIHLDDKLMFINTQAYNINVGSTEPMSVMVEKVAR
ncbi:conserved hypothetical protein [Shewanella violacea DSS12]|uniref:Lipoprotein-related protein n=1 Tax=Shewanella violacea (strain JCM 10179 / CIP 106290 / LMG 19151 / DSS12) TaxID=637905 RepID=D4ZAN4_SHEVD|nr:conserved hypothetical protein [Shewanella violacea DSS12]